MNVLNETPTRKCYIENLINDSNKEAMEKLIKKSLKLEILYLEKALKAISDAEDFCVRAEYSNIREKIIETINKIKEYIE